MKFKKILDYLAYLNRGCFASTIRQLTFLYNMYIENLDETKLCVDNSGHDEGNLLADM